MRTMLYFVTSLFCFQCVSCSLQKYYIQKETSNIVYGSFFASYNASSRIECAIKCEEDGRCITTAYVEIQALCLLVGDDDRTLAFGENIEVLKRQPRGIY